MEYNKQNTPKRKSADDQKYSEGWDRIFGQKKKEEKKDED